MKKIQQTILPNGITVITEALSEYHSVCAGIYLDHGSRDETLAENGLSHFYEHMVFKGTEKFSALDLVKEIESRGGYINAYTTRETTCFYAKAMYKELPLCIDILSDMINSPLMDLEEFEKEKEVIIEEIQSALDVPEDLCYDLLMVAIWGESEGLGRPIAGEEKGVEALSIDCLNKHVSKVLNETKIIIAVAGRLEHEQIVEQINKKLNNKKSGEQKKSKAQSLVGKTKKVHKDVHQATVMFGAKLDNLTYRERIAFNLIHHMLGDGMSSRLFQSVREKEGLVYSIYTSLDLFRSEGLLSISFASDIEKSQKAIKCIQSELELLEKEGWGVEEFSISKRGLTGGMMLHRESTSNRMTTLARMVVSDTVDVSFDERIETVNSITLEEVNTLARKWLKQPKSCGVVLPENTDLDFSPLGMT